MPNPSTILLEHIAKVLRPLLDDIMFVGGTIVSLYISNEDKPRPTKDVDIVIQVVTKPEFYRFLDSIKELGFKEDQSEDAPICRYVFDDIPVDFMPTEESVLGFKNKWFKEAMLHTREFELNDEIIIKVISPIYLLAAKIESFRDRGGSDLLGSKDAEDIVSIIDGYSNLAEDYNMANEGVKTYIQNELNELQENAYFEDSVSSQLRYSADEDAARQNFYSKLSKIT